MLLWDNGTFFILIKIARANLGRKCSAAENADESCGEYLNVDDDKTTCFQIRYCILCACGRGHGVTHRSLVVAESNSQILLAGAALW